MNELDWHLLEDKPSLESVEVGGAELKRGARIVLRPRKGGDIMDVALAGKAE